jgi:hypothetical protein
MKKIFGAIVGLMLLTSVCAANDIYISQNGGGAGTSCSSAFSAAWFNSSSNWGSGNNQIGPGTTAHLCGTITSELTAQGSGTSSSKITVVFEAGASIQRPYCDTNGCFNFGGNNYVVLDGGANTPCGWNTATNASEGACIGFIQATSNGSSKGNQQGGVGVACNGSGDEIRNLGIYDLYDYVVNSGVYPSGNVSWIDTTTTAGCSIHDNKMHDAGWGIEWIIGSSASGPWNIYNNEIYNMSHGPTLPYSAPGGTVSGINIYGNYIHDYTWSGSGCGYHNDGIHLYGQATGSSATTVSANIYNNIFGGVAGSCLTAHIFMESTTQPGPGGVNIYNNLAFFSDNPTGGTGIFGLGPTQNANSVNLYNNTLICSSAGGGPTGILMNVANFNFKNNLLKNCSPLPWWEGGAVTGDHNAYDTSTCTSGGNSCFKYVNGNDYASLSSWQSASKQDANSQGGATNLASYVPQSGSSAIGAGLNLTGLNISTLDLDLAGMPRAASGTCTPGTAGCWDAGAYQYTGGTPPPQPPTALTAVVN